jgi:hypothetical protein
MLAPDSLLMKPPARYEIPAPADIVVYAHDRRLLLAVEIKETRQPSAKDATSLRRSLHAHGLVPDSAFYLIVYPTTLFLWRRETPAADPPDYTASTKLLEEDAERGVAHQRDRQLRKGGLQLLVFGWLSVLANDLRRADPTSDAERMLIDSGVYEALRHGEVQFEADR